MRAALRRMLDARAVVAPTAHESAACLALEAVVMAALRAAFVEPRATGNIGAPTVARFTFAHPNRLMGLADAVELTVKL